MLIRFSCFVIHINSQTNLIEFYCSISLYRSCILFALLNASISMLYTTVSCHFSFILILSNSKYFSHIFRYSINFSAMIFSVIVNTMCCLVRDNCTVCINTSSFFCGLDASLILFRYSIELIFEIRFYDYAIMRLFNHAFDFALF